MARIYADRGHLLIAVERSNTVEIGYVVVGHILNGADKSLQRKYYFLPKKLVSENSHYLDATLFEGTLELQAILKDLRKGKIRLENIDGKIITGRVLPE